MSKLKLTTYANLEDMIRGTVDDPEVAERSIRSLRAIELSADLFALRNLVGLTQDELAERIGWTQSKLSRFEHKDDADISLGELQQYLTGLGRRAVVQIVEGTAANGEKLARRPKASSQKAKAGATTNRKSVRT